MRNSLSNKSELVIVSDKTIKKIFYGFMKTLTQLYLRLSTNQKIRAYWDKMTSYSKTILEEMSISPQFAEWSINLVLEGLVKILLKLVVESEEI